MTKNNNYKFEFKKNPLLLPALGTIAGILLSKQFSIIFLILLISSASYITLRSRYSKITLLLLFSALLCCMAAFLRSKSVNSDIAEARGFFNKYPVISAEMLITDASLSIKNSSTENFKKYRHEALIKKIIIPQNKKLPVDTKISFLSEVKYFKPGDYIKTEFSVYPIKTLAYEGAFSFADYNKRMGIAVTGRLNSFKLLRKQNSFNIKNKFFRIRKKMVANTFKLMSEKNAEFTAAVLFGYRKGLSETVKNYFRKTGTGHLLAISGLHIGLAAAIAWFLTIRITSSKRVSALAAIIFALFYLSISGGRSSAVRAAIMIIIYLGGYLFYRKGSLLNSLSCSAIIILFINPSTIEDTGFLLSFSAVIFISRLSNEINIFLNHREESLSQTEKQILKPGRTLFILKNFSRKAVQLLFLSASALIGIWPLIAYYFKTLALSGLLLNVAAVPLLPAVLTAGILVQTGILIPHPVSAFFVKICEIPASLLIKLCSLFSQNNLFFFPVNPPEIKFIILYYLAFLIFFMRHYLNIKLKVGLILITAAFSLLIYSMLPQKLNAEKTIVTILPAYDSECAVLEIKDKVHIFGKLISGGIDAGSFLRKKKIPEIENIFYFTNRKDDKESLCRLSDLYRNYKAIPILYKTGKTDKSNLEDFDYRIFRNKSGSIIAWKLNVEGYIILITKKYWLKALQYYLTEKESTMKCNLLLLKAKNDSPANRRHVKNIIKRTRAETVFYNAERTPLSSFYDRRNFGAIKVTFKKDNKPKISAFTGENWKMIDK